MWAEMIQEFSQQLTPDMWKMVALSTWETVYMSLVATSIAVFIGVPVGFLAFLTGQGQILQQKAIARLLNVIINIGRSVPFIILLIFLGGSHLRHAEVPGARSLFHGSNQSHSSDNAGSLTC